MPPFNDALPEELEPRTRELTALLEHIYQQPAAVTSLSDDEQQRVLARARIRLLNSTFAVSAGEQRSGRSSLAWRDVPAPAEPVPQPARPRRRYRLLRTLNAIAAVLMVGVLIAGAVILFTSHAPSTGGGPVVPEQPLPCFLSSLADDGLASVCQKHLYQDLNIVSKKGQFAVILTRAYADRNRVVLSLRLEQLIGGHYTPTTHSVVNVQDLKSSQGQLFSPLGGIGEGTATDNEMVSWYAAPATLPLAFSLRLHLDIQVIPQLRNGIVPTKDITNVSLDFSLPLHPELRTIPINQTIIVEGVPMSIKDMRVSPSEVLFDATYNQNLSQAWPIGAELTIGTAHCSTSGGGPNIYGHQTWSQLIAPSVVIAFGCSLSTAHGPARLVLKNSTGDRVVGTFHFTVPALQ